MGSHCGVYATPNRHDVRFLCWNWQLIIFLTVECNDLICFGYTVIWVSFLLDTFGNLLWDPFRVLSSPKCLRILCRLCRKYEKCTQLSFCWQFKHHAVQRCLRDPSKFVSFCCCLNSTGVERVYKVGDCTSAANSSITFQCGLYCSSSEPLACCLIRNMSTWHEDISLLQHQQFLHS